MLTIREKIERELPISGAEYVCHKFQAGERGAQLPVQACFGIARMTVADWDLNGTRASVVVAMRRP